MDDNQSRNKNNKAQELKMICAYSKKREKTTDCKQWDTKIVIPWIDLPNRVTIHPKENPWKKRYKNPMWASLAMQNRANYTCDCGVVQEQSCKEGPKDK